MNQGMHLLVDACGGTPKQLKDADIWYDVLDELTNILSMRKMMDPYIIRFKDEKGKPAGVTGFVVIAESHLSVHTYPETGYFAMDLFSCKPFDVDKAIAYLQKKLGNVELTIKLEPRGMEITAVQ